jgi:hypothetical protein
MEFSPRSPSFETIVRSIFPNLASMFGSEVNEANFVNRVCELLRLGLATKPSRQRWRAPKRRAKRLRGCPFWLEVAQRRLVEPRHGTSCSPQNVLWCRTKDAFWTRLPDSEPVFVRLPIPIVVQSTKPLLKEPSAGLGGPATPQRSTVVFPSKVYLVVPVVI